MWGAFLMFVACSGTLEKDQYVKWVQDQKNGLHVSKKVNDFIFDLQFQPTDYVLVQRHYQKLHKDNYEEFEAEVDHLQYYVLKIEIADSKIDFINHGLQSIQEKQEKIYYFSYLFQDDIYLEEEGKKLPCVLFHFERAMDMKNSRTFVLGFEKPLKEAESVRLVINSSDQFEGSKIKIKISKKNIPSLKI